MKGVILNDNKTAHNSDVYDEKIVGTIPFYREFHQAAIGLVTALNPKPGAWLDTGCGTGSLGFKAYEKFPGTAFTLADPSAEMLETAKNRLKNLKNINFIQSDSQSLECEDGAFDVITAIQCHHYLDRARREAAVENCFRMLKTGGVFITFEKIMPLTQTGVDTALRMWGDFQTSRGKSIEETKGHLDRFSKEYFPITIFEHVDLLKRTSFSVAEVLWASYMQAGFYAIK